MDVEDSDNPTVTIAGAPSVGQGTAATEAVGSIQGGTTRRLATGRESRTSPGSRTGSSGLARSTGFARSTAHSNADPLQVEEAARARGWSLIVIALTSTAGIYSAFLPGTFGMLMLFRISLIALFVSAAITWFRARTPEGYTTTVFRAFGWCAATASFGVTYFIGVFSPVPLIITLGITFFGLGIDRRHAIAVPVYATIGYLLLSVAVATGWLPDTGLVKAEPVPPTGKLLFITLVPAIYITTLWMARLSRRTMRDAIDRSKHVLVVARLRAAQLAEAQQNLEEILRAGAGGQGRYTGARAGDYELGEVIGRGAMGEVYEGTGSNLDRVAVKVLRTDRMGAANLERFFREGELGAKLRSPNIVRVYDAGQVADGMPYIAMEHLEGEDLATKLRRHTRIRLAAAVDLVDQVANGLAVAHAEGIIHRDLKPHNLFEARQARTRGTWKILDFGVSKLVDSSGTLTQAGVVGTPGYMAPEQARGKGVDQRTDVFGLAAVTYRMLTGSPPFRGSDTPTVLFEVVYKHPPQPSQIATNLTMDIDRVLAIAMSKRPDARFQTARRFADALAAAVDGTLPSDIAARADAAIEAHPWGAKLTGD